MYDDDLDALAAEYVLGTLSAEERIQAEAMIGGDPGFVEIVRQWERRLGELNVMVEAVEPPTEIWDKIKADIGAVPPSGASDLAPLAPLPPQAPMPQAPMLQAPLPPIPASPKTETKPHTDFRFEDDFASLVGPVAGPPLGAPLGAPMPDAEASHEADSKPASERESHAEHELESESESEAESEAEPEAEEVESESETASRTPSDLLLPPSVLEQRQPGRGAEVIYLSRRVRRWRGLALGCGALAAALAALIVVSQVKPGLIPGGFHVPQLVAQSSTPSSPAAAPPPGGQLMAVLQQDPSAPAFLLTVDPSARTMTVRTVAAKAEASHSFQLWLIASRAAKPVSLGLIGGSQYTELALPADFDAAAIAAATYAVSFEPAGGSKTGAPTGPILFTGRLVDTAPPPSPSKT